MDHLNCRRAIFVGDDITDEDVFRLTNPAIVGIRVGRGEESQADYYLQGQHEMIRLLHEMIAVVEQNLTRERNSDE